MLGNERHLPLTYHGLATGHHQLLIGGGQMEIDTSLLTLGDLYCGDQLTLFGFNLGAVVHGKIRTLW